MACLLIFTLKLLVVTWTQTRHPSDFNTSALLWFQEGFSLLLLVFMDQWLATLACQNAPAQPDEAVALHPFLNVHVLWHLRPRKLRADGVFQESWKVLHISSCCGAFGTPEGDARQCVAKPRAKKERHQGTNRKQYSKLSANQTKGEGSKGCGTQKATHKFRSGWY